VLLAALAAGAAWWWRTREAPPEPPLPAGITDPEVAEVVSAAHQKLQSDRRSGTAWGEYGTVLLANLFDREADRCFAEASRLDPDDPRWPYARGQIALKRDPPAAVGYLTAAAEAARGRPKFRSAFALALAEAILERGEADRAEALFRQELNSPDADRAAFGLGLVALARGNEAEAWRAFEAVRGNPSCRKQAAAQLARLARARGDVPAARQYEAEANSLEADAPWPDPYLDHVVTLQAGHRGLQRRVGVLERDGRFAEAAEAYLAQARHKRTSQALTGAAVNVARLRDYDRAVALLREAVRLDPADSNARYTLALVLYTKAEKEVARDPNSAGAAAEFREVAAEAKGATELKPDHALAYMFRGLALKQLGRPKDAIEPLRTGLAIRPEQFDLHLALGQCLAATGDRGAAEESFKAAARLKPDDPRPAQELAKLGGR
jgi:tetratricopeptide (TPR) repeat protein